MENLKNVEHSPKNKQHGRNYDRLFIKKVVREVEKGLPLPGACRKYGLSKTTLYKWLDKHASIEFNQSRRRVLLPHSTKRSIVRAITEQAMTIKEAATAYKVTPEAVAHWIKNIQQENTELSVPNRETLNKKKKTTSAQEPSAHAQIKALEDQLADARLKMAALNTLIDVAEEQLKINIRKKPGARQS